ncbi:permease-like cell division protein FtsX [Streptomyces indicus]|uniref:Cell division protein FtsX n=1 Tax=Streptomyces indicus TaxID=417292 RepID=A0A1G9DZ77_9ACTN|nr:permease-like cell division protein FtsX [Streptomyces indicus]SDK69159.1 cell division transport system permease protein [Streptomyces indicus]
MRAQFVLSEIGVGLRRNLTMTIAVIVSVALSLALFGGALLGLKQVSVMKGYWYDKVNVAIYLCNKGDAESDPNCTEGAVTAAQKKAIETDLKKLEPVEQVIHEDSQEAFNHYQDQYGNSPLAQSLTPDQMQESFRVKLDDPEKFKVISSAFTDRPGVQSVQDQRDTVDKLFELLNGMNMAALALMGLMLVVALMLIVNTVRVSAFSRRRETGIMRLVGASSFYIQLPFIMEAAFAGVLGAFLASVLLGGGHYFMIDHGLNLADKMPLVNFVGLNDVFAVLPFVIVIGLLMPGLAAFLALRKYLKV